MIDMQGLKKVKLIYYSIISCFVYSFVFSWFEGTISLRGISLCCVKSSGPFASPLRSCFKVMTINHTAIRNSPAFICFKYIFTGCPFLLPGLFKTIFSILIPGLLFWDCWFFSENILRKEASAHFSLSNTLSHFPKFSAYTSATEIHLDHPPHHTPGTGLQCLLHCWTKKQKMWCLKFWTN